MTPAAASAGHVVDTRAEPWPGLNAYREADSEIFFGRDIEAVELFRCVERTPLTIVFGPSGTGKTSLLQAGLFPQLRAHRYLPIYLRLDHAAERGGHAARSRDALQQALAQHAVEAAAVAPPLTEAEETLWEYLHRMVFWDARNHPVTPVLVYDQFEEIFTLGRGKPASDAFLADLADLVENYVPAFVSHQLDARGAALPPAYDEQHYRVVLSLREEYVPQLDFLRRRMPSVMHNRYPLRPMSGDQALQAVLKPGFGLVDEPVARRIVRFVAAAQSQPAVEAQSVGLSDLTVEPALLSVVCRELNARRRQEGHDRITAALVDAAHSDILDAFYERGFQGLDPAVRVFVEDHLLTGSGFRSTAPIEEAVRAGVTAESIETLIDHRILRTEERLRIPHIELTHDVLTRVVQRSRGARQQREQWQQAEQDRLERERVQRRQQQDLRRTRLFLLVVGVACAISVVLAVLALRSSRRATAAQEAATRATAAEREIVDKLKLASAAAASAQKDKITSMFAASWKSAVYFKEWDRNTYGDNWVFGARTFYNKMKPVMSLDSAQSLAAPERVFVAGPHQNEFVLNASDFGRYNPKFVEFLLTYAVPAAGDESLRRLTQPVYDSYFKDAARVYYGTYHYLRGDPAMLQQVIEGYSAAVAKDRAASPKSTGLPNLYLRQAFEKLARSYGQRRLFSQPAQPGENLNYYTASVAPGFWVRRTIDGTAAKFYELLEKLLDTYDRPWRRGQGEQVRQRYAPPATGSSR
jgi:hypothetical protein